MDYCERLFLILAMQWHQTQHVKDLFKEMEWNNNYGI